MPESKDHSRIRLERVKSDQRFLSSEIRVTLILKHLLIPFLKKKLTRKPHSLKESKIKKKLMPRRRLIPRKLKRNWLLRNSRLTMSLLEKLLPMPVLLKIKKSLMPIKLRKKESQLKVQVMTVPPKKKQIKKLMLHSAHQRWLVCADRVFEKFS